jgi:EAL domain-containing protein (putative c-di-GMP-specific phosphodiesterase class I)
MGRQLGLKIVAEGVETQEQLKFLATHGCTLAQGFYIARPVEAPRWRAC